MDRNLLAQQLVKGALYEGATDNLGRPLQQFVELLDVVAPRDAEEFEHGLVILEGEDGLVACEGSVSSTKLNVPLGSYCRET
jgi:hypothetical protein